MSLRWAKIFLAAACLFPSAIAAAQAAPPRGMARWATAFRTSNNSIVTRDAAEAAVRGERRLERGAVDDGTARGVDQEGPGLHRGQLGGADQAPRGRGQRTVQARGVGPGEEGVELGACRARAHRADLHAERLRAGAHAAAGAALAAESQAPSPRPPADP